MLLALKQTRLDANNNATEMDAIKCSSRQKLLALLAQYLTKNLGNEMKMKKMKKYRCLKKNKCE